MAKVVSSENQCIKKKFIIKLSKIYLIPISYCFLFLVNYCGGNKVAVERASYSQFLIRQTSFLHINLATAPIVSSAASIGSYFKFVIQITDNVHVPTSDDCGGCCIN